MSDRINNTSNKATSPFCQTPPLCHDTLLKLRDALHEIRDRGVNDNIMEDTARLLNCHTDCSQCVSEMNDREVNNLLCLLASVCHEVHDIKK